MKVAVIGGTGHIGTFLIPRLVQMGCTVTVISRGMREPYIRHEAWRHVEIVTADREIKDKEGSFGSMVASLKPDAVIDLVCFTKESAEQLVEAVGRHVQHLLICSTVWAYGAVEGVPLVEDQRKNPICEYGRQKYLMEQYLFQEARKNRMPVTVVSPGHIVGPGWLPLNPQGNFSVEVWKTIKRGDPLYMPHLGMETVHHVHADDVAAVFVQSMRNWSVSVGEEFFALSPQALSLRSYAEFMYRYFGNKPDIRFCSWEDFIRNVPEEDAFFTMDHISKSPCGSIEKARNRLQYYPRYTSLEAVIESVSYLEDHGKLTI